MSRPMRAHERALMRAGGIIAILGIVLVIVGLAYDLRALDMIGAAFAFLGVLVQTVVFLQGRQ